MRDYSREYQQKLVSAEFAASLVKSHDWIDYGNLTGQTVAFDQALAKRVNELTDIKIWTILPQYIPQVMEADPEGQTFTWHSWHFSKWDRRAAQQQRAVYYAPIRYSELPRYVREHIEPIDIAVHQVAPMDEHGYFNYGPQNSHSQAVFDRSRLVIVEVNQNQPRCLGGYHEAIHISQVDHIIEGNNPPLPELIPAAPSIADKKVAEYIVKELYDGCCLQLGIGPMPLSVGQMIAQSDLKNLGCHTEMMVDSFVDMVEAGRITGRYKTTDPGKLAYTFALGTQRLYDFLHNNPMCSSYPVDYTNNVRVASANDNLMTINNVVEVDIYGQVCAESVGTRHISGTGGQLDFVLAAYESRGGKSFLCLPSTHTDENGVMKSRIVPILTPGAIVTDSRTVAQHIVTEYGMFNLKGKSTWQRAEGLIGLAHPDFRDDLIKSAQDQNIWRRSHKR
ncbi:MAG: acetyl-CoA hydrolase/transferase C-terminal domain-containing protein [Syntrophomonadaceae bacterium]|nr:butyryl-CoA:acetate CoA-transferase [Syntrophomonadaceae bacterium]